MEYIIEAKQPGGEFKVVKKITIKPPDGTNYTDMEWDSRTGLVTGRINGDEKRVIIPYEEVIPNSGLGALPPAAIKTEGIQSMEFNYRFY